MSGFIEGVDRDQVTLFPERLEDWIGEDHLVRVVDLFVDQLDLAGLGFVRAAHARTGRPGYHPAILLKLLIYGYLNRVPSSRRLEREAGRNVEPPRVYRRAKLSENCPLWNRIERRPQSRIHLSFARVRCGLSRSIVTNIEATQQRMLRSPANWAVRQTVFASGFVRPNVMAASGRERPVLRRLVSKSLNARTGNCVRPMRS